MFSEHVQSRSRRATARHLTHEKVLAAAEQLFITHGCESVSVRSIAAEAGVSVGTVMGVGSKDDLLVMVFTDRILSTAAAHRGSGTTPSDHTSTATAPPDEASTATAPSDHTSTAAGLRNSLRAVFADYIALITAHPELARAWGVALLRTQQHADTLRQLRASLSAELSAAFEQHDRQFNGDIDAALYTVYLGALITWGAGACTPEEALDTITTTIDQLLACPASSGAQSDGLTPSAAQLHTACTAAADRPEDPSHPAHTPEETR